MDYTFGLDKAELAKYGAKAAVFDALRAQFKDMPIHPYVKVDSDMDPQQAQLEACRASRASYFVVRASSRYELLPRTAGMTDSEKFVHYSCIEETIQAVRQPTKAYLDFARENDLEPEKVIPVIVQPMLAESYGIVTTHPNQRMTLVDYFPADDSEKRFGERSPFSFTGEQFKDLERLTSQSMRRTSYALFYCGQKFYARYKENGAVEGKTSDQGIDYRHIMDLARHLFDPLTVFGDGFAIQGEFGPDSRTGEPVLYQLRPFAPKNKADFKLDGTQADMVFGIGRDLELPVVRIKDACHVLPEDFDTLAINSHDRTLLKKFLQAELVTGREDLKIANSYQVLKAKEDRHKNSGDLCLAMPSYGCKDGLDFLQILKPSVVVVADDMRAGMIHNRTNLIQSVPVTIFGNDLYNAKSERAKISSDGENAVVCCLK